MISRIYVMPIQNASENNAKGQVSMRADSYIIDSKLSKKELIKLAEALTNPILESYYIDVSPNIKGNYHYAIEIGFKPGVTDNVGTSVKEIASDLLHKKDLEIFTSKIFFVSKNKKEVEEYALSLYNPLIERAYIVQVKNHKIILPTKAPKVILKKGNPIINVSLQVSDEELIKIGKEGIMDPSGTRRGPLALDLASMKTIQDHFRELKRDPTDIELESLAQTWSEHCKHTIFANPIDDIKDGLYKTYIKGATNLIRKQKGKNDFCVSVFSDNSGGIVFDNEYLITHKVETHNSPSGLDPFGGAITGIVGVNRDTIGFGMGAKPVANVYGFCFGYPEDKEKFFRDKNLTQQMLSPKRIMDGAIKGINSGGNCSGIPTLNGFIKFDDRYRAKPMVFAGTVGLIPRKVNGKLSHLKKAQAGDYVVVAGGRVGLDGIHGVTFASVATDLNSPATAVQIGDPITQKKLSDAIIKEARDLNLYSSITDNGGGGLSCSVAEMAKECGGAEVNLEKIPAKYPGLRPWEIWISESQERMTLSVPTKKWPAFQKLMESRGVEATIIGTFTNSGKCIVKYLGKKIMDIEMDFLHDGRPIHNLKTEKIIQEYFEPELKPQKSYTKTLENLLGSKNINSFAFISQQYDHEVQATSVLKPLSGRGRINTDAQVFKPVLSSDKGVVITSSTYPSYGDISTYDMAACAIDTAIRNIVSAGGTLSHLAILDNFCWCSSNDPMRLGQLLAAVKACYDVAVGYGTPFISGKDSMFNDFKGYDEKGNPIAISIPPTLLISGISVMPDLYKTITPEFKNAGDKIYLLGETNDELGGGEYLKIIHPASVGTPQEGNYNVPKVNVGKNLKTYRVLETVIEKELLSSALSITSGGLSIALAKACIGGMVGCTVSLNPIGKTYGVDVKLFSESQGRILVSVSPKNATKFEQITAHIPRVTLGIVARKDEFLITDGKNEIVKTNIKKLHKIYHKFSDSMK